MEIHDLQTQLKQIEEEHGLLFTHKCLEGGLKLQNLISKAFIAGRRKARLEFKGDSQ